MKSAKNQNNGVEEFHQAVGVYGIISRSIENEKELLVIKKHGGPYTNRYDLPGGSQEPGELLQETLIREITEETNLTITDFNQLGCINYIYPWHYLKTTMNNHICIFYVVNSYRNKVLDKVTQFEGQDSLGAVWINTRDLSESNCSPVVLTAKDYLLTGKFNGLGIRFSEWSVYSKSVY